MAPAPRAHVPEELMSLDTNQKVAYVAGAAAVLPIVIVALGSYGTYRVASDSEWVAHSQQVHFDLEGKRKLAATRGVNAG